MNAIQAECKTDDSTAHRHPHASTIDTSDLRDFRTDVSALSAPTRTTQPVYDECETDAKLLAEFVELRKSSALAQLIRRHQRLVWGVCRQSLSNVHDAEDAFQATFLLLARQAHRIRKRTSIASWLHGVAYRLSARIRRQRTIQLEPNVEIVDRHAPDPLIELTRRFVCSAAHRELAALPAQLRDPMVLRYMAGKSNQEVADLLRLSVAAVEGRLKRAKARLRYQLTRNGVTLGTAVTVLQVTTSAEACTRPELLIQMTIQRVLVPPSSVAIDHRGGYFARLIQEEAKRMVTHTLLKWSPYVAVALSVVTATVISRDTREQLLAGERVVAVSAAASDVAVEGSGKVAVAESSPFEFGATESKTSEARYIESPFDEEPTGTTLFGEPNGDPYGGEPNGDLFGGSATSNSVDPNAVLAADPAPKPSQIFKHFDLSQRSIAEQRIESAMQQPTRIDFFEDPLSDVATFISQLHDIQIVFDTPRLDDIGITTDTPISLQVNNVSLRSALELILNPIGLDAVTQHEVLMITTREAADEEYPSTRVYPLVEDWPVDLTSLAKQIPELCSPSQWSQTGGDGSLTTFRNGLIIRQSQRVHREIESLFEQLSTAAGLE